MTLRRGLIVAPSWIGDAVLAQPLFQRLQERHPGLVLDALAPRWVAPVALPHGRDRGSPGQPLRPRRTQSQGPLGPRPPAGGPGLRRRLGPAQFPEIRPGHRLRRHSAACRLHRRGPLRPAQLPPHPGQKRHAPDGGTLRPGWRKPPAGSRPAPSPRPACTPGQAPPPQTRCGPWRPWAWNARPRLLVCCPGAEYGPRQTLARSPLRQPGPGRRRPGLDRLAAGLPQGWAGGRKHRPGRRGAAPATCAAPPAWTRPSTCWPWPTTWSATIPA